MQHQPYNPLHGITLKTIVTELVEHFGFEQLASFVDIRCFKHDPSIKSSLAFLRKTPWARDKVEQLYIKYRHQIQQAQQDSDERNDG
ncbi:VF530 family DNA-binding protein [Thalassotalea maritima]|uniref:VF530 family protein n=1 Tax=Thalassotalea maritima TaxID=3242416 RepID=UPI0035275DED